MESTIKVKKEYILILNETEAKWLKGVMQNPLFVNRPEDEDEQDASIRSTIWNALNEGKE